MLGEKSRRLVRAAVSGLFIAGLVGQAAAAEKLVSFAEFLRGVKAAAPAAFVGQAGNQVGSDAAFSEMRQHVVSLYDGVHVAHSYLLDTQQIAYVYDTAGHTKNATLIPQQPSPTCYRLQLHNNSKTVWRSYFFFGGPGGTTCAG
jgi:hypothetical protein